MTSKPHTLLKLLIALGIAQSLALAACGGSDPSYRPVAGASLLSETFDAPGDWEEGAYPPEAADPASRLAIAGGRYEIMHRAERAASFTWGAEGDNYEDVIVDVRAEQLSTDKDNLYGVLCRLAQDDAGDWSGYALLISGDGHYGIADLSRGSLDFLLEWHQSGAIEQGQATNTIRAVCAENYLAVYANGEFLGEVKDSLYRRAGQVGLIAGASEGAVVHVAFDDLTVFAATLSD
ncbi:MAG: hypothetical protein M5U29_10730 [Anaerolineae bacterium]|nr:hypothetical protein [Anaerolineae bacterium]